MADLYNGIKTEQEVLPEFQQTGSTGQFNPKGRFYVRMQPRKRDKKARVCAKSRPPYLGYWKNLPETYSICAVFDKCNWFVFPSSSKLIVATLNLNIPAQEDIDTDADNDISTQGTFAYLSKLIVAAIVNAESASRGYAIGFVAGIFASLQV